MDSIEKELDVLQKIYHNQQRVRQREIARSSGMSLGMTNAILKRLAHKGWITIRKVNNRNIQYIVSPDGVDAIMKRSYRFLKRTMKNVSSYRDVLEALAAEIKSGGFSGVVLVGRSDMEFIVEHVCRNLDLTFATGESVGSDASIFYLHSENSKSEVDGLPLRNQGYLRDVLMTVQI